MQEQVARLLVGHVLVNRDDVDVRSAHGLQHWLQLARQHREVAVNDGLLIGAGKTSPSVDAHFLADLRTMHRGRSADGDLEHAIAALALLAEEGFERRAADAT